jgi:hypothetical protein
MKKGRRKRPFSCRISYQKKSNNFNDSEALPETPYDSNATSPARNEAVAGLVDGAVHVAGFATRRTVMAHPRRVAGRPPPVLDSAPPSPGVLDIDPAIRYQTDREERYWLSGSRMKTSRRDSG